MFFVRFVCVCGRRVAVNIDVFLIITRSLIGIIITLGDIRVVLVLDIMRSNVVPVRIRVISRILKNDVVVRTLIGVQNRRQSVVLTVMRSGITRRNIMVVVA